jgi:hypothetical protein
MQTANIKINVTITGDQNQIQHIDASDIQPCKLTLFISRPGQPDTSTAELRWWSDAHINFDNSSQTYEMTVPMDGNVWHSVYGEHNPSGFSSFIQGPVAVGFTLGGQFFDGHGVYSANLTNGIVLNAYQLLG